VKPPTAEAAGALETIRRRWGASSLLPRARSLYDGVVAIPGTVSVRAQVRGTIGVSVQMLGDRQIVMARSHAGRHRGALRAADGASLAEAARLALAERLPLVLVLASAGADVTDGIEALHGWGRAASAITACSGTVPVIAVVRGPAISGPALLLGLADAVVMTPGAFAFLSGPHMVAEFTGIRVGLHDLGGSDVHAQSSGLCALQATGTEHALELVGDLLRYLPDHADALAPPIDSDDPVDREVPELSDIVPAVANASYDVRRVAAATVDDGEILELRPRWAPQVVTALASVGGTPVGIVANQPQTMAGTLDIAASQKAARFVRFCDAFNLPIVTFVDTPGFLPGKDLEWRGMIRHGAELAFAYAEASVPRICVVLRKAYGGAYIVMDSKGMGNDLCLAWPTAEIAVMGAQGAVQILHRGADAGAQAQLRDEYAAELCTPWIAAERGFVDAVIDPVETRAVVGRALAMLATHIERIAPRKHDVGPL